MDLQILKRSAFLVPRASLSRSAPWVHKCDRSYLAASPASSHDGPGADPGTTGIVKCRFKSSRVVQPVCTNSHVMRPYPASLPINGSKEIGLFVAAIFSLYIRLRYNKPFALVKNLLTSIAVRGQLPQICRFWGHKYRRPKEARLVPRWELESCVQRRCPRSICNR